MSSSTPKISSLRLLVLSPPGTASPELLQGSDSPSGPTLNLKTPYYSASIPIWHDTLEFTTRSIQTWEAEWKTPEAAEVVRSIGAWAICFPKPASKEQYDAVLELLRTISALVDYHQSTSTYSNSPIDPPLLLAIALPQSQTPHLLSSEEQWQAFEDACEEVVGWEVIDGEASGRDSNGKEIRSMYGEKMGMERVREACEAYEWNSGAGDEEAVDAEDDDGFLDFTKVNEHEDEDDPEQDFGRLQDPISGLHADARGVTNHQEAEDEAGDDALTAMKIPLLPISSEPPDDPHSLNKTSPRNQSTTKSQSHNVQDPFSSHHGLPPSPSPEGSEAQIGDLEQMMQRLQAVKEMSADLPEAERKRAAKKAVAGVMKML